MNFLFKVSRWIHKYIGLVLIVFLIWMSITGVLINHPGLIAGFSVPRFLTPYQFIVKNWNGSSLTRMEFSKKDSRQAVIGGKLGVFKTVDGGESFYLLNT